MSDVAPVHPAPLRTRSLRRRVTVAVLVFVAAMLLVLGVSTDLALRARLEGDLRARLSDRASFANVLTRDQVQPNDLVNRLEGDGISISLTTTDGQVIAQGSLSDAPTTPTVDPPGPRGPAGGPRAPSTPITQTGDLLQITETLSDGSVMTLTASAADVRRTLAQVRTTLLVAGLVLLALSAAVVGPIIGRVLRPLDQMTAAARSITAGDRGRRLRPDRPGTELGRTAEAFDAMLDEIEGAETQARTAEHRLRGFLSDAAHELRTPLAGVQAAAERLLRTDPDRAQREQLAVTTIREARRAGRLVDDMLTMTRIDQGLALDTASLDLTELVRRLAQTTRLREPDAQITVEGGPVRVVADPDRITQVLTNLLDNAFHAAGPSSPVELCVSESAGPDGRPNAQVTIRDHGPGIPSAEAERVFERLVRLDLSRTAGAGGHAGSGLGLSIARGLARAHGGDLALDPPPPGGGAQFRLRLPLS